MYNETVSAVKIENSQFKCIYWTDQMFGFIFLRWFFNLPKLLGKPNGYKKISSLVFTAMFSDLVWPLILASLVSSLNKSSPRTLSVLSSYKVCHAGQQRYRNLFFAQSSTYGNPDSNRGIPNRLIWNPR